MNWLDFRRWTQPRRQRKSNHLKSRPLALGDVTSKRHDNVFPVPLCWAAVEPEAQGSCIYLVHSLLSYLTLTDWFCTTSLAPCSLLLIRTVTMAKAMFSRYLGRCLERGVIWKNNLSSLPMSKTSSHPDTWGLCLHMPQLRQVSSGAVSPQGSAGRRGTAVLGEDQKLPTVTICPLWACN